MRSRRKILLLIGCGLLLGVAALALFRREPEPSYQGKALSEWLDDYQVASYVSSEQARAAEAIRHIGTNAIPHLLKWALYHESPFHESCRAVLNTLLHTVNSRSHVNDNQRMRGQRAAIAFGDLGEARTQAVPELSRCLNLNLGNLGNVATALSRMGQLCIAPLTLALTNADPSVRWWAALRIRDFGTNAKTPAVISALLKARNDPLTDLRLVAGEALGTIAPEVLTNAPSQ